jgi:hypothetical protein
MIAMSGMAAVAALAFSAGPAAASDTAAAKGSTTTSTTAKAAKGYGWNNGRVVGYYRSPGACHRAGRIGEWRDRWDDYTCYRVPFGYKRGLFALKVYWDHNGGWNNGGWHNGGFGGGNGHIPILYTGPGGFAVR